MTTHELCARANRSALLLALSLAFGCGGKDSTADASTTRTRADGSMANADASTPVDGSTAKPHADGGGAGAGSGAAGSAGAAAGGADAALPPGCPKPAPNQPPDSLSCTGLYSDIATKTLSTGVQAYAPAIPLWSDGAGKGRWVYLPPGKKIDVSDPDSWKFPVGTKFWKEFKIGTTRVETRMFWKISSFYWTRTAYQWNAGETEAMRTGGADITVNGKTYHIPSTTECDTCHKGRQDRALGFETILLGLPGATGLNLAALQSQGLLNGTLPSKIQIGDDGTGKGSEALGWLHVNCGVSCHNGNSASEAYSTMLKLDLDVANANGSSTSMVDAHTTAINVPATTGRWKGRVRITPGSPSKSLLYSLMSTRNATNMKDQMPPIASRVVPTDGAKLISDWITAL